MTNSEEQLLAQHWERFVGEYYPAVFRFLVHFLGSRAEAEDAVQEVFLKAWEHLQTLPEISNERAWIYSIARNYAIDRTRWWKRLLSKVDFSSTELENKAARDTMSVDADVRIVLSHVKKLPTRQREVFILRHWHGFSTEEVAKMLGISTGSVKTHLKRSIEFVKTHFVKSTEVLTTTSLTIERL